MFDLEKSIIDWRKQMLAAGIKTPVPLEELEIHLREEIDQQMKSELNEQGAFYYSVQKIGQGKVLKNEFNKAEGHKMWQAIMLIIGWLAAGIVLVYSIWYLDFSWDFMFFLPKWDLETIAAVLTILAAEIGIWFLAKAHHARMSRVVSLLVCLLLAGLGIFGCLPAEQRHATFVSSNTSGGAIVGRVFADIFNTERPSPIWFRGSLTLLLCVPSIFWVWRIRRQIIQKRNLMRGSQPIHSS